MSRKMVLTKGKGMKEWLLTRIMQRLPCPARNQALTILTVVKLILRSQVLWVSIFVMYCWLVFKEIKSTSQLFLGGRVTFFSLVFYICFADDDLLEQGVLFGKLILFFTTTVLLPHGKCFEIVALFLVFLFFFPQFDFKCHIWNLTYSLKCCVLCLCF